MKLKTRRGSNQYQTKAEIVDAVWCPKCGRPNFQEWTNGTFPMPIKPEKCKSCGAALTTASEAKSKLKKGKEEV